MDVPTIDDLARDLLETAPGLEVVTDHVELPPHRRLPTHTVHTGPDGATLVVFRVHEVGEPDRTLEMSMPVTADMAVPQHVHLAREALLEGGMR